MSRFIQIGIKLYTLVVSAIIPSLKEIGLKTSKHMTLLKVFCIKLPKQDSLPWILILQNKFSPSFNKQLVIMDYNTSSKWIKKFAQKKEQKILLSHTTGNLNEGHGYSN